MNKRTFLKTAAAAAATVRASAIERDPARPEFFELRTWTLKTAKQPLLDEYLSKAFIPAVGRAGSGPVGVFSEAPQGEDVAVTALIVHPTIEQVAGLSTKLTGDADYQKAAHDYLAATPTDPIYARIESSLHRGIPGMPKLARTDPKQPRLFNLRIYENHNERAAAKKVEMFTTAELAIFRRVGLTPVFFGETLVGGKMPNLTYMLVFPDEAGRKAAWSKFGGDPEWQKLKAIPEFMDKEIVLKITNKLLTPAGYSEL
jgi:hypothetical protein